MFDISFIELIVIFVVALLVLGPEKLPGAVRTGALWVGRAKRSFSKVKAEIEQQLNTDDIRRQLHNESILADIEKARKNADSLVRDAQKEVDKTRDGISRTISSTAPPVPVVSSSAVEGVPTGADDWPVKIPAPSEQTPESEPDSQLKYEPEPAVTAVTDEEKPQVQDFYNSPPTGVVTVKGRKLAAAEPVAPEGSSKQKD